MQQCRKHLQRQVSPFDVAGLAAEKEELEKKMGAPDFWDDVEAANKANQRMKTISAKLEKYNKLRGLLEDAEVMADMAEEGDDQEMADELIKDMPHLESKVEALKLETLLKGPYDRLNAILSLHAGAGVGYSDAFLALAVPLLLLLLVSATLRGTGRKAL